MNRHVHSFRRLKAACGFAFLLVVALNRSASAHATATYALSITHFETGQKWFDTLRLYNTKTRKTVWTRKFKANVGNVEWSKDKRAVAINVRNGKILVWRLGYKTRFFDAPSNEDYVMGFHWSPDHRRLLIRCGGSGDDMTPDCNLYCLDIQKRRLHFIHRASEEFWASNRKVLYKNKISGYDFKTGQWIVPRKFRVWHSP